MNCIFAIDAGGTKCSAMLLDEEGRILGWSKYSHPGVSGRTMTPITIAAHHAIGDCEPEHVHIAYSSYLLPGSIPRYFRNAEVTIAPVTEDEATFRLAEREHGIVVLAGTGAFTHFSLPSGQQLRLDGWGPLIGDFGSAFYIGQKALQAMCRSRFHKRHETILRKRIIEEIGHAKLGEIGFFSVSYNDRATIASLASLVDQAARKGDRISRQILIEAAQTLAETVHDGADHLGVTDTDLPFIGTGSVITNSDIYWDALCQAIHGFAPGFKPVLLHEPQIIGVALQALHKLHPNNYPQLRENLLGALEITPEPTGVTDPHPSATHPSKRPY